MIKSSKHIIKESNQGKQASIDQLFSDYKHDLNIYINYIIDGVLPLKTNLSSKDLPNEIITHSRYKQIIYKEASSILRSQLDKSKKKRYNNYKKIYSYMMKNHPDSLFVSKKFSDLNLNNILNTKYFNKPNLNNISINLDERFYDIKQNAKHFDSYVKVILPYFNEKGTRALSIKLPLNYHKHSNNLKYNSFILRNNIQIKKINNEYYITLIWFKDSVIKRTVGSIIGLDMGYKKLIVTSDKQYIGSDMTKIYENITKKKRNSNNYYKSLSHRDNEINRVINSIDFSHIKTIVIEDLNNVKRGKSFKTLKEKGNTKLNKKVQTEYNNKSQYWSYRKAITKIENICDEHGITLVKVSPAYTSQECSSCGHVDENSRKGENFKCTCCKYEIDADYNASINIRNKGTYSSLNQKS